MAEENFEVIGQESGQKRNAARTQERFPVEFRLLPESEYQHLQKDYTVKRTSERPDFGVSGGLGEEFEEVFHAGGASQVQIQMFQQLMRAMKSLERRLDDILEALGGKSSDDARMNKAMCVDLSATGMKMVTAVPLEKDSLVQLLMPLPPLHPVVVGALGRVVKAGQVRFASGKKACEAAVHFEAINEDDREEIVAYSFKRQRQEAFHAKGRDEGAD